jgi:hypothetical protein
MGNDRGIVPLGSAELQLRELQGALDRGEPLLAVHYGCEDLYKPKKRPAAVACIALADIDEGSSNAFSLLDPPPQIVGEDREIDFLRHFYEHLRSRPDVRLLHWNMNHSAYGFTALATRYRYLTGHNPPYEPSSSQTFDIDKLIGHRYGIDYARHSKLPNIAALNGLSKRFFLEGKEEAGRFASEDIEAVRNSVSTKARIIGELFLRLAQGVLLTQSSVGSVQFAGAHLDAVKTVLNLADKLVYVQRGLRHRGRNRPPIECTDEYDDQYLLGALLRVFFDDVRSEEWTPSYAGSSSRIDFVIPTFRLALELKHTRETMSDRHLGDQLIVDRDRYGASQQVNHLICLVFDGKGHLVNPRALEEDLSTAATVEGLAVTVRIFDR